MKIPATEIKKIAVFRALQLGDMLCVIPAIRALRAAYPDARITLLGLPWASMLTERFHEYFDEFIWFPGYPGLPEQQIDPARTAAFFQAMIDRKYDLILQMQGNGSIVNPMIELLGAKYTAGFCIRDHYYPQNDLFLEYPDGLHEIERHLALVEHLGIGSQGIHLEFPITWQDEDALAQAGLNVRPQEYVCIHPGSRGSWRQWPTYYFAEIADIFAARGFKVVVTGTSAEAELVNEVIHYMQYPSINAAGKTSLGAIAALIRDAYALVSNCTGVSHIAAATATRSIVISMDGEPERWAPLNKDLHYTVDWTKNPDFEAIRRTASVISSGEGITSGFSIT